MGGLHDAVHQAQGLLFLCYVRDTCFYPCPSDLQAILQLDPGHNEARELLTFINDKDVIETDNVSLNRLCVLFISHFP